MTEKTDEKVELDELREKNKELIKTLEEHLLRRMLASWLVVPSVPATGLLVLFILNTAGAFAIPHAQILIDLTILETINSDIFMATVTLAGLIVGIVPLISFFYLGELKDIETDIENSVEKRKKGKSAEIKKMLEVQDYLYDALLTNMRKTIKRYTQIAVAFSVFSLLGLLCAYMGIGIQNAIHSGTEAMANNLSINILLNVFMLFYIAVEVFPLVGLALYDSGYKVTRLKDKGREIIRITPEE